jgi:hypothetical protein
MSLEIFCSGLDMKSALDLDIATRGSFAHKTPMEGREILYHLLENSSFSTIGGRFPLILTTNITPEFMITMPTPS